MTLRLCMPLCCVLFLLFYVANTAANGIAFSFSGAGGRISQHAALMSCLVNGTYPQGIKLRPDYLAGASSGALTAVLLSAILETQEKNLTTGISFEEYKQLLFNLNNAAIFKDDPIAIAEIFTHNLPHGFILDVSPFETTLSKWLSQMNYYKLSDLYIPTAISIVERDTGVTKRLWSDDPKLANISLLEVLMASTALPIAFEPRTITGYPGLYIDGGTGVDTMPVVALLERPEVKTIYAVVYNSAFSSGGASGLPFPINDIAILVSVIATINDLLVDLFDAALDVIANDNRTDSYLYLPTLPRNYSTLDFSDEKLEFMQTYAWGLKNDPVPITPDSIDDVRAQFNRLTPLPSSSKTALKRLTSAFHDKK